MSSVRLISWNTAHRKAKVEAQAEALLSREPDLVALQEVIPSTAEKLTAKLQAGGLEFSAFSEPPRSPPSRSYGVLLASRTPLERLQSFEVPWPEKILSCRLGPNERSIEIHVAHVPNGSGNKWIKIETLEGIYESLSTGSAARRILCGDFNAPQLEFPTGELVTWAQIVSGDGSVRTRGRFRGGSGARWDAGERQVLEGLAKFDLHDAFRRLHGPERHGYSWVLNRKGKRTERRFDHVLSSGALSPIDCQYLHEWRETGLSDHSPIEATFEIR